MSKLFWLLKTEALVKLINVKNSTQNWDQRKINRNQTWNYPGEAHTNNGELHPGAHQRW